MRFLLIAALIFDLIAFSNGQTLKPPGSVSINQQSSKSSMPSGQSMSGQGGSSMPSMSGDSESSMPSMSGQGGSSMPSMSGESGSPMPSMSGDSESSMPSTQSINGQGAKSSMLNNKPMNGQGAKPPGGSSMPSKPMNGQGAKPPGGSSMPSKPMNGQGAKPPGGSSMPANGMQPGMSGSSNGEKHTNVEKILNKTLSSLLPNYLPMIKSKLPPFLGSAVDSLANFLKAKLLSFVDIPVKNQTAFFKDAVEKAANIANFLHISNTTQINSMKQKLEKVIPIAIKVLDGAAGFINFFKVDIGKLILKNMGNNSTTAKQAMPRKNSAKSK